MATYGDLRELEYNHSGWNDNLRPGKDNLLVALVFFPTGFFFAGRVRCPFATPRPQETNAFSSGFI